ncbi:50S ribosomal protein L17 [Candidatus Dependentiae bacterium]|nr:MAG: 50S ribosomal protein L17 [Candidatus Dependentiae bacterium]
MRHQKTRKKLNLKPPHKRSLLRNQVIHLITYGHLVSTKVRLKEVKKLAEKVVTIAREGNTFNARRRAKALLPYKNEAVIKLFTEIAPRYIDRPGGYTRIIPLGRRVSDTANMARLEWV